MKTEVMTMDPISGVDMGKVKTQVPPAQESRQLGRHFVLAYVGAWAFVYDRAISLYQGTLKLITDAEKRGEGMESALSKKMNRFQRKANRQRDTIQEPLSVIWATQVRRWKSAWRSRSSEYWPTSGYRHATAWNDSTRRSTDSTPS